MKRNFTFHFEGSSISINLEEVAAGVLKVKVDDEEYVVRLETSSLLIKSVEHVMPQPKTLPRVTEAESSIPVAGSTVVSAPMPGTVMSVKVKPGDLVNTGDTLLTLETMKMENPIKSPKDGVVKEIKAQTGKFVNPGEPLILLE